MKQGKLIGAHGFLTYDMLKNGGFAPGEQRCEKGPVVVVECVQEIPCNPCEPACNRNCIRIGDDISALPVVDFDSCSGCGLCVSSCPGLAIFIEDSSIGNGEALVSFPYEYHPLPEKGDFCQCVDRQGEYTCEGTVEKVLITEKNDKTAVVTVRIPREFVHETRSITDQKEEPDEQG